MSDTLLDFLVLIAQHRGETFAVVSPTTNTAAQHVVEPMGRIVRGHEITTRRSGTQLDVTVFGSRVLVLTEAQVRHNGAALLRGAKLRAVWVDPLARFEDRTGHLAEALHWALLPGARLFHADALPRRPE